MKFFCLLICQTVLLAEIPFQEEASDPLDVQLLVQQLGSESFQIRQKATQRLWNERTISLDALRRAAENVPPEAAQRIHRILLHLERGLSPNVPPRIAQLVFSFLDANESERYEILNQLLEEGQRSGLLKLEKDGKSGGYLIVGFGPEA